MNVKIRKGNTTEILVVGNGTKKLKFPAAPALKDAKITGLLLVQSGSFHPDAGTSTVTTNNIGAVYLCDSKGSILAVIPGHLLIATSSNTTMLDLQITDVDLPSSYLHTANSAVPGADTAFQFIFITE